MVYYSGILQWYITVYKSIEHYTTLNRLKDQNKKLTTLTNNKKLGEREKLELDITTAKVTIAHQESKIQVKYDNN